MASNRYQYETSPRKIRPEYNPKKKTTKRETRSEKEAREKRELEEKKQKEMQLKQEKRQHHKNIALVLAMFLLLLTVSYRNSLITERFSEIQDKKQELSAIQKTNEQTAVSIEGSINLKSLEKSATDKLGMQKLENSQKVYVTLPKEDYTESATQEIAEESNSNWIENLIAKLFK